MKPLFVKGCMERRLMQRIMVDDGTRVNVMPMAKFEKMGFLENELMRTNTSVSAFTGEITETKGVMSVELTMGSKTMATTFFVVDVKGRYNLLLGRDWIHSNSCVPSTLHLCLIQWVVDNVEVVPTEDHVCVAVAEAPSDGHDEHTPCLSGRDLSGYDYISVSKDGLVSMNVRPTKVNRLNHISDQ
jgi:hypothetical protein